jgi:hypothetical protein
VTFYNLLKYTPKIDKKAFLNAINSQKPIAITLDGEILDASSGDLPSQPYIFVGQPRSLVGSAVSKPTPLAKILGDAYEVRDEGDKVAIYAGRAWPDVLNANAPYYLYQDTTSDGITEFSDEKLDDLIWYSCEFGINYREVAEFLEKEVDGAVVCIENEQPYHFNGCAYADNLEEARNKAYDFIKSTLQKRVEEGKIDLEDLEEDEEEALKFFEVIA